MKMLLSIEQSTDVGGVALLSGPNVLAERTWVETRARSRMFDAISGMLDGIGLLLDRVEFFVVGLGPGSYTGLRTSLAAAMAFALPGRRPVYGVQSAEALALTIMDEYQCDRVMVAGDARRGCLWIARFDKGPHSIGRNPSLVKPAGLADVCREASVCVTADWDRIGPVLERELPDSVLIIKKKRVPSAIALGRAAFSRIEQGIPSERVSPIYLHSAVAD